MSSLLDIARAYTEVISVGGDIDAMADFFSNDFQNFDKDGKAVLDKEGLLAMGRMMRPSFTDYGFVLAELRQEDDFVIMTGHFEGILSSDLDLSAIGLGVIPASGKKIVWPEASAKLMFEGDKIVRMEPYAGAAGLRAFLAALGVELPSD